MFLLAEIFVCVCCHEPMNDAYTCIPAGALLTVTLCCLTARTEKEGEERKKNKKKVVAWMCWHFEATDPQQTSINGMLYFMEVCCIIPARRRSSSLCQLRWCSTNLHKSVFHFTLHEMLFKIGFWFISVCCPDGNASKTSTSFEQQTPWHCDRGVIVHPTYSGFHNQCSEGRQR